MTSNINNISTLKDLRGLDPAQLSVRERILRTAVILFNRQGIHTTGIDKIIAESETAKMSFYKHFPSKGKLVAEYLRYKDSFWFDGLRKFTDNLSLSPEERLLGIFDFLGTWFSEPDFRGCPFIKGLSEFDSDYDSEVLECIASHFAKTQNIVEERVRETCGEKNISELSPKIMSLIAGATIVAQATGSAQIARANRETAQTLIKACSES